MTSLPPSTAVATSGRTAPVLAAPRGSIASVIESTKPGITRLVTVTAGVGFLGATAAHDVSSWGRWLLAAAGCLTGTAAAAAGANALNMWLEADRDGCMERTRGRPIPSARLSKGAVFAIGFVLSLLGPAVLVLSAGPMPALLSVMCVMVYVLAYTPLKTRSRWSTLVGTVPGALPILIGWTAAVPSAGVATAAQPGALALFALMTLWQLPHFGAIAWMHREDYARGGHRVVSAGDTEGSRTARSVVVTSVLYCIAATTPGIALGGIAGLASATIGAVGGVLMLVAAIRFSRSRTTERARSLFLASVMTLPPVLAGHVAAALIASAL